MLVEDEGLKPPVPLSADERRVLGVLIEKSLTTPDAYPMTRAGLTAGCSQKSNRSPVAAYSEERVDATIDALREKSLVNEVHTAGGRTEKFRQVARVAFGWNEVQLAAMGELLLRGRQSIGDLRSRANRMRPIDSLDVLREALSELKEAGYVRASGPLTQRGVQVDHALYEGDSPELEAVAAEPASRPAAKPDEVAELRAEVAALRQEVAELRSALGD